MGRQQPREVIDAQDVRCEVRDHVRAAVSAATVVLEAIRQKRDVPVAARRRLERSLAKALLELEDGGAIETVIDEVGRGPRRIAPQGPPRLRLVKELEE